MAKNKQKVETDDRAKIEFVRDENNKIKLYSYEIFKRNKTPLVGKLTREEMASIYRLYSFYGAGLTQRQISRMFPDLSLVDFKRILRAFNITKASSPFPPHMIEELSEEKLREIQLREKENDFLRKAEMDIIKYNEKLLKEYAKENIELKKKLESINTIQVDLKNFKPSKLIRDTERIESNNHLILYLSDLHVGARVDGEYASNEWNEEELIRRLNAVVDRLSELPMLDCITIVLLGDHLDGMDEMTSRRDHLLPQNMNNTEQVNAFINNMLVFISTVKCYCNKLDIYCVKCGNHAGDFEYVANLALKSTVDAVLKDVKFTLFNTFFGEFSVKNHHFLVCHGKDPKYMKKPMPLNLNDFTKIKLYEYMDENGIRGNNIHVVKGDLHTENINSCDKFDYRNVLSLFGASDYCAFNYSKNQYGVSYDLFIGDVLVRGTFENM